MPDARFPRSHRLSRSAEFDAVFARRCSAADDLLIVYGLPNGRTHARLGLSVSRKVGSAVVRNRWKRAIREAFRQAGSRLPRGIDLVVIPRPGATLDSRRLGRSLAALARRVERKLEKTAR